MKLSFDSFRKISPSIPNALYYSLDSRVSSNIYLLIDEKNGKKMLIDSGDGKDSFAFTPDVCFLTHAHFDHTGGVSEEWKHVFIHPLENARLPFSKIPENAKPVPWTSFDFGQFHFEVIHTPGHTPGSMCLFETTHSMLFSGDTLFAGGVHGRTDLAGSDAEEKMEESLHVLSHIGWKTLCPGHGEPEFKP